MKTTFAMFTKTLKESNLISLQNHQGRYETAAIPELMKSCDVRLNPESWKALRLRSSLRPVSSLPSHNKVTKKIISEGLDEFTYSKSLLPDFQVPGDMTAAINFGVLRNIAENMRCHTAAVFLDMRQALDGVRHDGLATRQSNPIVPLCPRIPVQSCQRAPKSSTDRDWCFSRLYTFTSVFNLQIFDIPSNPGVALYNDDVALINPDGVILRVVTPLQDHLRLLQSW